MVFVDGFRYRDDMVLNNIRGIGNVLLYAFRNGERPARVNRDPVPGIGIYAVANRDDVVLLQARAVCCIDNRAFASGQDVTVNRNRCIGGVYLCAVCGTGEDVSD